MICKKLSRAGAIAVLILLLAVGVTNAQLTTSNSWGNITTDLSYSTNVSTWNITLNFTINDATNATAWYNITFPSGFDASTATVDILINGTYSNPPDWSVSKGTLFINVSSNDPANVSADVNTPQYINISNLRIPATLDVPYTIKLMTNASDPNEIQLTITVVLADNVSAVDATPTTNDFVPPGYTYIAYNITYWDNASIANGTILKWFNATINQSVQNPVSLANITNVTVLDDSGNILGWDNNTLNGINVSLNQLVSDSSWYNLSIQITLASNVTDGTNVSLNGTLKVESEVNSSVSKEFVVNDPDPETVSITAIKVSATPPKIGVNIPDLVTVTVTDFAGNPLNNSTVIITEPGGTVYQKVTNTNGIATFVVNATATGNVAIDARYYNASGGLLTNTTSITAIDTIFLTDSTVKFVNPGDDYIAYNITFTAPTSNVTLYWFNASLNSSVSNIVAASDIVNVTVVNSTTGNVLGYDNVTSDGINVSLSGLTVTGDTSYGLTVLIKLSDSVPNGKKVAFNATLKVKSENANAYGFLEVNDPVPETVSIAGIKVVSQPSRIGADITYTVTVKVTDLAGNPLQNAKVTISGAGIEQTTKYTASDGTASFTICAPYGGTITVKATFTSADSSTLTATTTIYVSEYKAYPSTTAAPVTPEETATPEEKTTPVETATPVETTPTVTPIETTATPVATTATPAVTETAKEEKPTPGFEAVFAITGLLAVAYLLRRK